VGDTRRGTQKRFVPGVGGSLREGNGRGATFGQRIGRAQARGAMGGIGGKGDRDPHTSWTVNLPADGRTENASSCHQKKTGNKCLGCAHHQSSASAQSLQTQGKRSWPLRCLQGLRRNHETLEGNGNGLKEHVGLPHPPNVPTRRCNYIRCERLLQPVCGRAGPNGRTMCGGTRHATYALDVWKAGGPSPEVGSEGLCERAVGRAARKTARNLGERGGERRGGGGGGGGGHPRGWDPINEQKPSPFPGGIKLWSGSPPVRRG